MTSTAERNRAARIAYGHARHGRAMLAEVWLELAATFAPLEPRQRRHAARLLLAAGSVHPDQLDFHGRRAAETIDV